MEEWKKEGREGGREGTYLQDFEELAKFEHVEGENIFA